MISNNRKLPSVNSVLEHPEIQTIITGKSRWFVTDVIRGILKNCRDSTNTKPPSLDGLILMIKNRVTSLVNLYPQTVINASGVILHTNLGRAPLSNASAKLIMQNSSGYHAIELDLDSGKRGSRQKHASDLLKRLTGAEDSLIVNNNAAALYLCLSALVPEKNVIVSRGEAVEIGGNFRIPEIASSGSTTLKEVGTTNRTYARDYANAVDSNTGAFLKVHTSNFKVSGFTHETSITELSELSKTHKVPVIFDLGSGCLLKTEVFGLKHEPTPQESIKAGIDVTLFSGDKLLGGPQAGIIIGKKYFIDILKQHPLYRILRIDKINLTGLTRTLLHYIDGDAITKVPVWKMISRTESSVKRQALQWSKTIGRLSSVTAGKSTIGGGSLPGETLPTWLIKIDCRNLEGGVEKLAQALRTNTPPIIGRIENDELLLDLRTVELGKSTIALKSLCHIVKSYPKK